MSRNRRTRWAFALAVVAAVAVACGGNDVVEDQSQDAQAGGLCGAGNADPSFDSSLGGTSSQGGSNSEASTTTGGNLNDGSIGADVSIGNNDATMSADSRVQDRTPPDVVVPDGEACLPFDMPCASDGQC